MTARRIMEGAAFGSEVSRSPSAHSTKPGRMFFTPLRRLSTRPYARFWRTLSLTRDDSRDVEQIPNAAVKALRGEYTSRFSGLPPRNPVLVACYTTPWDVNSLFARDLETVKR